MFVVIIAVIVLAVSMVGLGSLMLRREFRDCVKADFVGNNSLATDVLGEGDIAQLPAIVQRYLYYTRCVGQPKVKNFMAEFAGGMRGKPGDEYMKVRSVQYNFYERPSRYFFMVAKKMGLPASGLHIYNNETATFRVKMLNLFKVVDAKGDKMNQAETVTLFNDMCFIAPATLIDKKISCEVLNETTIKGVYRNGDFTYGELEFKNVVYNLENIR